MKRLLAVLAAAVCFAAIGVSASSGSAPTVISFFPCVGPNGGSETVPAGTTVVLRAGWVAKSRGLIEDWFNDVTTTAALNGKPVANADSLWTSPISLDPYWETNQYYSLGTLGAGQSETLTLHWTLSHPYWDGITFNPDGSRQVSPAGIDLVSFDFGGSSCTITGN